MLKTETILLLNYLQQTKEKNIEKISLALDESRKKFTIQYDRCRNAKDI